MQTVVVARYDLIRAVRALAREIGSTPLIHFTGLSTDRVSVYGKAEWQQLSGSVKARAAYRIIADAVESGQLNRKRRLLDASSGNTAIAYGAICSRLGIPVTICLPRNASAKRIELLHEYGVEIIFTSEFDGTEGAQEKARELNATDPDRYFYADQYSNSSNWRAHYDQTATEILEQTSGNITHFVTGLGTTGTFTGVSHRLRKLGGVECIGLQPDGPLHIMEGWKHLETADVPSIYDAGLADKIIEVTSEEAVDMMIRIYEIEGLKLSPSAAANLAGAAVVAGQIEAGVIVTILTDGIDRYRELEQEVFGP